MKKIISLLACASLLSCSHDGLRTYTPTTDDDGYACLKLSLSDAATRASLLEGCEEKGSGVLILCFDSNGGELLSAHSFAQSELESAKLKLQLRDEGVDMLLLGNLNYISRTDPSVYANLYQALGEQLPVKESEYEAMVYRLDGAAVNAQYRRETFAEVAKFGIPYMSALKGLNLRQLVENGGVVNFSCERLFSKVSLRVNCASLTGGNSSYFRNPKLYVRQANIRLCPFSSSGFKALSSADVLMGRSDFDEDKISADTMEYSLYVPENMQGTLLPGNSDNMSKTPQSLSAAGLGDEALKCLTYIEFSANVDPLPGGYGGDVQYHFYLGSDSTTNFDLERNKCYNIELSFKAGKLVSETVPVWKLDSEAIDTRLFCICPDAAYSSGFASGKDVVVRPSRPARFYVYMNPSAAFGSNSLRSKPVRDPSYEVSSIVDCGWTSDFLSQSNAAADVPLRSYLIDECGVTPSYDESSAMLSFTVTDHLKYQSHIGQSVSLNMDLLPQAAGDNDEYGFRLLFYPDMVLDVDNSGTLYPAMKRIASLDGFYSDVRYKMQASNAIKTQASDDNLHFIPTSYNEDNKLTFSRGEYLSALSRNLNLYSYSGALIGSYNLSFCPEDSFNDGPERSFSFNLNKPNIRLSSTSLDLDIAGTWKDYYLEFKDAGGEIIPASAFDAQAYRHIYTPVLCVTNPSGPASYLDPLESGTTGYSMLSDEQLQVRSTTRTSSSGHPVFQVSRKCMGQGTSYYVQKGTPVNYKHTSLYFLKSYVSAGPGYYLSSSVTLRFLPFMASQFALAFYSRYDDWSFCDDSSFNSQYKNCDALVGNPPGKISLIYVEDMSQLEYYAVPTHPQSHSYGSRSQSVRITQQTQGGGVRIKTISRDGWTNLLHSVGPHDAYAAVTNIHSGECVQEKVGSFSIYANLVIGGTAMPEALDGITRHIEVVPEILVDDITCVSPLYSSLYSFPVLETSAGVTPIFSGSSNFYVMRGGDTMVDDFWRAEAYPRGDSSEYIWYGDMSYNGSRYSLDQADYARFIDEDCSLLYTKTECDLWIDMEYTADVRELNLPNLGTLRDGFGKGYYSIYTLKQVSPASRGWTNNL